MFLLGSRYYWGMVKTMHNFMKLKYFAKDEKNPYLSIFTCTGHYMSIKDLFILYKKNNIFLLQVVNVYLK